MNFTRQFYLIPNRGGKVLFVDKQEFNYDVVCQPRDIIIVRTEKPCEDEKALKTEICASVRAGQGIGEKGWYKHLIY